MYIVDDPLFCNLFPCICSSGSAPPPSIAPIEGKSHMSARIKRKPVPVRRTVSNTSKLYTNQVSPPAARKLHAGDGIDLEDIASLLEYLDGRFTGNDISLSTLDNCRSISKGSDQSAHLTNEDEEENIAGSSEHSAKVSLGNVAALSPINLGDIVQPSAKLWNPFWLRREVLFGLLLLYSLFLMGVILLYHLSVQNHGLSTEISSNHYTWTYGPTAVLTVLVFLWQQVDYNCRILAPWSHLKTDKPVESNRSLLLDYVSPTLPTSLYHAFRYRDWAVVSSIVGLLVLRVIIIFSTGLLVQTPTSIVSDKVAIPIDSMFDGIKYQSSMDDSAALTYYGILTRGMEYPYGTTESIAFNTVNLKAAPQNVTITTSVDGFYPEFNCEVVPANYSLSYNESNGQDIILYIDAHSSSCPPSAGYIGLCQPQIQSCASRDVRSGYFSTESLASILGEDWNVSDPTCGNIWQISVAEVQYSDSADSHLNVSGVSSLALGDWTVTITNVSTVVCHPTYSVNSTNITVDITGGSFLGGVNVNTSDRDNPISLLDGFTFSNLSDQYYSEMGSSLVPVPSDFVLFSPGDLDALIPMMMLENGNSSLDAFLEPLSLRNSANNVFKAVASQIARYFLIVSKSQHTPGTVVYTEQRLQVRILSVWFMGAGFVILIILTLAIACLRPYNVVPRNPNSIASNAAILASSKALGLTLDNSGVSSDEKLARQVGTYYYRSILLDCGKTPEFIISTSTLGDRVPLQSASKDKDKDKDSSIPARWQPIPLRSPFILLSLGLPIGLIVALQVLQERSDGYSGIANADPHSSIGHSLTAYLSGFTMLMMALLYDSINSIVSTLAPYQSLLAGPISAKRGLLRNMLGKPSFIATVDAIRDRHFGVVLSSTAVVLGSLLTIIVSGLYVIEPASQAHAVSMLAKDQFNLQWNVSNGDDFAGTTLTLIEHQNATYPAFTFDELAFPRLEMQQDSFSVQNLSSDREQPRIFITIPATRASLNCSLIPDYDISILYDHDSFDTNFSVPLPNSCLARSGAETALTSTWNYTTTSKRDSASDFYFDGESVGLNLNYTGNPIACPGIFFWFGKFSINDSDSGTQITAFSCGQVMEEVSANATFLFPNLTIDATRPPVTYESTISRIQPVDFDTSSKLSDRWDESAFDLYPNAPENGPSSWFFQTVVYGTEGIPAAELVGPSNSQKLMDAVQHTYRKYMAQVISSNMRSDILSGPDTTNQFNGSLIDSSTYRIKQNSPSKVTLQVLLSVMLVCGILIYAIFDMRHTLPHNPCSIAGVMSLLAGSEMCERRTIPQGAEFLDDRELERVLAAWQFSLGWWGKRSEEPCGTPSKTWDSPTRELDEHGQGKRFGIDVGSVIRAGRARRHRFNLWRQRHRYGSQSLAT